MVDSRLNEVLTNLSGASIKNSEAIKTLTETANILNKLLLESRGEIQDALERIRILEVAKAKKEKLDPEIALLLNQ